MITLSKDMEVGVRKIDEQHKELINRINVVTAMGLKSASKEETQKTIDLLDEYIVKHFSDEEVLQRQCNYPKSAWHGEQHRYFISEVRKLKREFIENGPSPKFTLDLSNSLITWVVRHIKTMDIEFGKYYNAVY